MGVAATLPELSEWTLHALKNPSPYRVILASVSFWPLLIIESVETRAFHALLCPNTCFSSTTCSLSRYNVKIELDCFNCKTGVFLRLFTSMFTKQNNCNPSFAKKIDSSMGNIQQL